MIHALGEQLRLRILRQPEDQNLVYVLLYDLMRNVPETHADNLAPDQLQAFAFGLRHRKELRDCYQRRGCAHSLIVLSGALIVLLR